LLPLRSVVVGGAEFLNQKVQTYHAHGTLYILEELLAF
jgi:hypothetical protein